MGLTKKKRQTILAATLVLGSLALAAGSAQAADVETDQQPGYTSQKSPGQYVDHDTAVKMGGVGNYVSKNDLKAYNTRVALQNDLKQQVGTAQNTLTLPESQTVVFFNTGQSQLTPQGQDEVGKIAAQVREDKKLVAVIGAFTDNTGSKDSNEQLSKARAKTVESQLLALGVPDRQIRTDAFGEGQPIASNTTDQGRAMNRRAELYIENFKSTIG